MDGILLVDKPEGITSADVVRALKGRVGRRKIGHLGTLDPFASGLLPICIGEGTKIAQFLSGADKTYTGRICLGVETDSLDRTGQVVARSPVPPLDRAALDAVRARFVGETWQTPPMYSAIKQEGVPLYRLARRGIEVERSPRRIEVRALSLEVVGPGEIAFEAECSKGTYVRVLAADVGRALGCGGHLAVLRRTRFGLFDVAGAHALATLEAWPGRDLPVVPIRGALGHLRELHLAREAVAALCRGQQAVLAGLDRPSAPGELAKVLGAAGEVVAVVEARGPVGTWRIARMLGTTPSADS